MQTLDCVRLADDAMIQVHSQGITHIRPGGAVQTWRPPSGKAIERATCNKRQVVVALTGGTLIYFELDATGQLRDMMVQDLDIDVTALHIGDVPEGRSGAPFLVVGCWDSSVRFFSLAAESTLKSLSLLRLGNGARATSLCVVTMADMLQVMVAMDGGIVERYSVDPVRFVPTGRRTRFLGMLKPIKLVPLVMGGSPAVLAVSDRCHLYYTHQGQMREAPVTYDALEHAACFVNESLEGDGVVAVAGNTLRIFTIEGLGQSFHHTSIPLKYTPRKMCVLDGTGCVVIVEADHNEFSSDVASDAASQQPQAAMNGGMDVGDGDEGAGDSIPMRGPLPPAPGHWGSCVRMVETRTGQTVDSKELTQNDAALSLCAVQFSSRPDETFVAVGVGRGLTLHPRCAKQCSIHVYKVAGSKLELVHATDVEDVPMALTPFMGRLAVGVGRSVRIYEMGKKKLLRKCENKMFPSAVVRLTARGSRLYVGDLTESVHFVRYHAQENVLTIFADDTLPRFVTGVCAMDYDTVAGTDKFGNAFMLRLAPDASDAADASSSQRMLYEQGLLNGAPNKAECIANYYLGAAGTAICRAALTPGKEEIMVVATVTGGLTALVPFQTPRDVDFFRQLETFMRAERTDLCGRDHLSYRSYFQPVKNVVDGALCELYLKLPLATQNKFAETVERSAAEVCKKIEDFRYGVL
jgi:splicing factor 3B subunit 3